MTGRRGRRKIPLPPEAVEEYLGGAGVDALASRYGMSTATLRARLHEADVTRRRRPTTRRLSDEQVVAARRRYLAGATSTALGAELGVSREAMRQALTGLTYFHLPGAVAMREKAVPSMPAAERDARIVQLGRDGMPLGMITAKTNVSRERVLAVLAGAGIEPVIPPRKTRGSERVDAKLVEKDVAVARQQYRDGATCAELARRYGVTAPAMARALRGSTWSHVPRPVTDEEWRGRGARASAE